MSPKQAVCPLVSVIVPVYNVEQYLEECLESLLNQTLENIELIFIDDCSTDKSLDILENSIKTHEGKGKIIKIIKHRENKGVSFTREEGVKNAQGEWIIHCDADDIPERDMYEKLYRKAQASGSDIVVCSYRQFGDGMLDISRHQGIGIIESKVMLGRIAGAELPPLHGALWNKLIKKNLWADIVFPKDVSFCEDSVALFQILSKYPHIKIELYPELLYGYRVREGSLVKKKDQKRIEELERLIKFIEEEIDSNEDLTILKSLEAKIVTLLYRMFFIGGTEKGKIIKYRKYLDSISLNKELRFPEKLFLSLTLKEHGLMAKVVQNGINGGKKIIKTCLGRK